MFCCGVCIGAGVGIVVGTVKFVCCTGIFTVACGICVGGAISPC